MKKKIALLLAAALALTFTACGTKTAAQPKDYVEIIKTSRADDYNEAYPILHGKTGEKATLAHNPFGITEEEAASSISMTMEIVGLNEADCEEYAVSAALINVRVYGVAIVKPAKGKEEAVKAALNEYVTMQQKAQENYLPDQYEIAKNAIVKQLSTGEIILVMDENSTDVASKIEKALQ